MTNELWSTATSGGGGEWMMALLSPRLVAHRLVCSVREVRSPDAACRIAWQRSCRLVFCHSLGIPSNRFTTMAKNANKGCIMDGMGNPLGQDCGLPGPPAPGLQASLTPTAATAAHLPAWAPSTAQRCVWLPSGQWRRSRCRFAAADWPAPFDLGRCEVMHGLANQAGRAAGGSSSWGGCGLRDCEGGIGKREGLDWANTGGDTRGRRGLVTLTCRARCAGIARSR